MKFRKSTFIKPLVCVFFILYYHATSCFGQDLVKNRIEKIIENLTLEEKVALCSGAAPEMAFSGIKRLNIPNVRCVDGPRGPNQDGPSTAFPTGLSFGASWNPRLVQLAGKAMGEEARAKGFAVLLAPGNNILRDPLNGRFFEYFTEDPFLNSEITVANVQGIQDAGVAACAKHYLCNNREDNRNFYMSIVDERTLHEIYFPAFKAAVQRADLYSIMTSANGVNNEFVSDSKYFLTDILKNTWKFKGFVLTDWLQTRSTEKAALAGLDVSMPGGNSGFGLPLLKAVQEKRIPESVINDKVRRVLTVYDKLGILDGTFEKNTYKNNSVEHQSVARQIAEEGMVLLKNQNHILPLDRKKVKKILVLGPNADKALCYPGAGGSSGITPPYEITALKGIRNLIGAENVKFLSSNDLGGFHLIRSDVISNLEGSHGFNASYFVSSSSAPVLKRVDQMIDFMWEMKSPDKSIDPNQFSKARYEGKLVPPMDGKYTIRVIVNGIARILDPSTGTLLAFADSRQTLNIANVSLTLKKDVPFDIVVEYEKTVGDAAIRLEWELPNASAEKLHVLDREAKEADAIIYVGGIDHSLDTEGRDRKDLNFPGAQENILNRLAKLNNNLVAVLINGSPMELGGWLPQVPAVLEAWYPGMESGTAIANILFGLSNPSGKLPFSWPKKLSDSPCKILATENNDFVYYTDSLLVGYRYYDTHHVDPEFPFGYGLSYSKYKYGNLAILQSNTSIKGKIKVSNIGEMDGMEVVQVYVRPIKPSVFRPVHELKAFQKIFIKKGKSQDFEFELGSDAFSYYDIKTGKWKVDPGKYEIEIGTSSRDIFKRKVVSVFN